MSDNEQVQNESKALALRDELNTKFLDIIKSEQYPVEVREGISNVLDIVKEEKQLTQLYPEVLAEVPISTSLFQDKCVQYEICHTPHKKLRQAILEMQNRLSALYTAKTGHKKAMLKVVRLESELEDLQEDLEKETDERKKKKLNLDIIRKEILLEEAKRGLTSSSHLVKDAALKVVMQQKLVEQYQKEVEESGLSFEESEFIYYVMYFTKDAEIQLRTAGRIDTGTFGAISQLPEGLRKKVLWNISFIKKKLFEEGWPPEGDYIFHVFRDVLEPKKTGPDEYEGVNIKEFLSVTPIKLLSKEAEEVLEETKEDD